MPWLNTVLVPLDYYYFNFNTLWGSRRIVKRKCGVDVADSLYSTKGVYSLLISRAQNLLFSSPANFQHAWVSFLSDMVVTSNIHVSVHDIEAVSTTPLCVSVNRSNRGWGVQVEGKGLTPFSRNRLMNFTFFEPRAPQTHNNTLTLHTYENFLRLFLSSTTLRSVYAARYSRAGWSTSE